MSNFKIAKIIDTTTIVINGGSSAGVKVGQSYQIIGENSGEIVTDPDTGKEIGRLDDIKGTVNITKVYPNMAVASTSALHESVRLSVPQINTGILGIGAMSGILRGEELNVDRTQISGGFESNTPVKIGDTVILDE